jgi:predicted amidohydrolase
MPSRRQFLGALGLAGGVIPLPLFSNTAPAKVPDAPPESLDIALLQMMPHGADQQANLKKADAFCRRAAKEGADIALMPEMWNIGYTGMAKPDVETTRFWRQQAVARDGEWVGHFRKLASELGIAIGVTYMEQWKPAPRNTLTLIDRHGRDVLTYAKVHLCAFAFEAALTPGDDWQAVDLDTAKGPVRVGSMICFDREFPESARSLMLAGAEVVLTPNACPLDSLRIAQFQVRAHENSMAVAMTNYPAPMHNGHSVAFGAAGEPLADAGESEGIAHARVDLAGLRRYRQASIWGNAWRRPSRYGALTGETKVPVFERKNFYGAPFDPSA